jgi:hypothetical protein
MSNFYSRRAARGAVLLQCILGTTWTVGYAYQGPGTIVFAYLFTILNSTQVTPSNLGIHWIFREYELARTRGPT